MFQQIVAKLLSEHEVMHELIVRLGRPERIHSVGVHQAVVQTRHRVFVGRPLKRLAHLGSLFAMSRKMSRASSDGYVFLPGLSLAIVFLPQWIPLYSANIRRSSTPRSSNASVSISARS
jgi:hypothetical protein